MISFFVEPLDKAVDDLHRKLLEKFPVLPNITSFDL